MIKMEKEKIKFKDLSGWLRAAAITSWVTMAFYAFYLIEAWLYY